MRAVVRVKQQPLELDAASVAVRTVFWRRPSHFDRAVLIYVNHTVTFDCTGADLTSTADISAVKADMVFARTAHGTTWRLQHIDCTP